MKKFSWILSLLFLFSNCIYADENKNISYHDVGKGLPIVLIHAFPTDKDIYAPQEAELQKHFRVITLDLWGFGDTAKTNGDMITMSDYADEVFILLNQLKIPRSVIGGESMGGYIALMFLKKHPEKVFALILSDTQCSAETEEGKKARDIWVNNILRNGPDMLKKTFLDKALAPTTSPQTFNYLKNIVEQQNANGMISALKGMAEREDTSSVLTNASIPILILTGAQDEVIPPQQSDAMHALAKSSKLVILPKAAHLSNLDQPELWNQAVINFLNEKKVAI